MTAVAVATPSATERESRHQYLMPESATRGKEKFVAFRDLRFATEDQIYANLSCEQREELRVLKREKRAEMMEKRFERRHGSDQ